MHVCTCTLRLVGDKYDTHFLFFVLFACLEVVKDVEKNGDAWVKLLQNNPSLETDCLSRALVAATKCDNPSNVGRLIIKGAANISEAIQLASKEGKMNAYAMLLLATAAMNDDCDLVRRLFGDHVAGCSDELQELRRVVAIGLVPTSLPVEIAFLRQNKSVAEELLLRTDVHQSEGIVYWHGLGLNAIQTTLLSKINWVKRLHLGGNRLSIIPTEISLYLQQVGECFCHVDVACLCMILLPGDYSGHSPQRALHNSQLFAGASQLDHSQHLKKQAYFSPLFRQVVVITRISRCFFQQACYHTR